MQESIQLSDHVKNRIKSHQLSPLSFSSDELILSDNDSLVSKSPQQFFRRRNSTFITTQIRELSGADSVFTNKKTQFCQECLRRENLLQTEHEHLLHMQKENRKLSEQFRSTVLLNQQYQEENIRLKQDLTNIRMQYQMNFQLFKQKNLLEKNQDVEDIQLKRLRHELQIYNQVIAEKRREEQQHIDYFYLFRKK